MDVALFRGRNYHDSLAAFGALAAAGFMPPGVTLECIGNANCTAKAGLTVATELAEFAEPTG